MAISAMPAGSSNRPVALATLHYGLNEGAVLQAYSVAQAVERRLRPRRVEILDHRYPSKVALANASRGPRELAIQNAVDEWLPLSAVHFRSESHRQAIDYVRRNCSAIIVGSDVLWRFRFVKRLRGLVCIQRQGFHTPVPNLYWPDETAKVPRISYAASIGESNWLHMPFWTKRKLGRILSGFEALSVRDIRTLRFLEWLDRSLARRAVIVPDPTWAIDLLPLVDADALRAKLVAAGVDFSRPRCGFVAGSSESARECAVEMRRRGYQIVGITTANDFSDARLFDHGFHPLEWARLFGFMDIVVTERMHGAIFCLQNETPLVVLDINDATVDADTKNADLLRGFGCERFCLSKATTSGAALIAACDDAVAGPWDWEAIRKQKARHRSTADVFLQRLQDLDLG